MISRSIHIIFNLSVPQRDGFTMNKLTTAQLNVTSHCITKYYLAVCKYSPQALWGSSAPILQILR